MAHAIHVMLIESDEFFEAQCTATEDSVVMTFVCGTPLSERSFTCYTSHVWPKFKSFMVLNLSA